MRKLLPLLFILFVAACNYSGNSTSAEQSVVNRQQDQYNKVQPIPFYDFSLQRQALIDIYNSQNQDTHTWDVITSYTGQFQFQCEAVGWPIPAAAQLSNPEQVVGVPGPWSGYIDGVVGQAEPNGVFTGNTLGTYVLCARNGKVAPVYTENNVTMFPFEVTVDRQTGVITDAGGPSSITMDVQSGGAGTSPPPETPKP